MFEVINGGRVSSSAPPASLANWKTRWAQLRTIETTMYRRTHSGMSPRANYAVGVAAVIVIASMALLSLLEQAGAPVGSPVLYGVPYLFGCTGLLAIWRCSKKPKTWTALLDQLLAAYEPIDRDAYCRLQDQTRDLGYLERDRVYEWLGFERHAVEVAAGRQNAEPSGFLAKKV